MNAYRWSGRIEYTRPLQAFFVLAMFSNELSSEERFL